MYFQGKKSSRLHLFPPPHSRLTRSHDDNPPSAFSQRMAGQGVRPRSSFPAPAAAPDACGSVRSSCGPDSWIGGPTGRAAAVLAAMAPLCDMTSDDLAWIRHGRTSVASVAFPVGQHCQKKITENKTESKKNKKRQKNQIEKSNWKLWKNWQKKKPIDSWIKTFRRLRYIIWG